jgi:hypothetical protein
MGDLQGLRGQPVWTQSEHGRDLVAPVSQLRPWGQRLLAEGLSPCRIAIEKNVWRGRGKTAFWLNDAVLRDIDRARSNEPNCTPPKPAAVGELVKSGTRLPGDFLHEPTGTLVEVGSRGGDDQRAAQDDCAERRTDVAPVPGRAVVSRGRPSPTIRGCLMPPPRPAVRLPTVEASWSLSPPDSTRTGPRKWRAPDVHRQMPGFGLQPPAVVRSSQARGHRFDPGWLR